MTLPDLPNIGERGWGNELNAYLEALSVDTGEKIAAAVDGIVVPPGNLVPDPENPGFYLISGS